MLYQLIIQSKQTEEKSISIWCHRLLPLKHHFFSFSNNSEGWMFKSIWEKSKHSSVFCSCFVLWFFSHYNPRHPWWWWDRSSVQNISSLPALLIFFFTTKMFLTTWMFGVVVLVQTEFGNNLIPPWWYYMRDSYLLVFLSSKDNSDFD